MSDFDHVVYDAPREPNWWRGREMTEEEATIYRQALECERLTNGAAITVSYYRLLKDGGGFSGVGITHSAWPRRILLYVAPFKGHFSEAWKQQTLAQLDRFYAEMKREIEEA